MDKIDKALKKITSKDRERIKHILLTINERSCVGLDIKKLVGQQTIFRVRVGQYRIIFRLLTSKNIKILAVEKRSDTTYNRF